MNEPDIKREITRDVYEHETFLAWNGDKDAVMFEAWWNERGFREFDKWAEKHQDQF